MLCEAVLIFVCLFAALGIVDLVFYIFTRLCIKRLPHHSLYIVADDFEGKDAERILRFIAEYCVKSDASGTVSGITLGKNAAVDERVMENLCREYPGLILKKP